MSKINPYQILEISQTATQGEIKQAYRRLVKQFHPDSHKQTSNPEKIIEINAAYEILGDPQRRRLYDQQLLATYPSPRRQQRNADAQEHYQRYRQAEQAAETLLEQWIKIIYTPIIRLIARILNPIDAQIESLSADPFDDDLMACFQTYLTQCQNFLKQAKQLFASQPNPVKAAKVAVTLYYCLERVGDGIDELEQFTFNYDDRHLHTGKELFRIAQGLRYEAQQVRQSLAG